MSYLRQHGFPSPLLDWTRSPYIAAYFAFAKSDPFTSDNVAVYVLSEKDEGSDHQGCSTIYTLRRDVAKSHKRYFLQQSVYTVCVTFKDGAWHFSSHDTVFNGNPEQYPEQYVVRKYIIPAIERIKVLKFLDNKCNLNASSLIGSEESLMETMKFRVFDLA